MFLKKVEKLSFWNQALGSFMTNIKDNVLIKEIYNFVDNATCLVYIPMLYHVNVLWQ